ncbi:MAG: bifunctional hydroxymethylpyrimidine kinase/phosphomethylpyrimidine kinase [Spirochaetaceae bacterium]|jgi:pyridoxine kinase|nr:bifunctional hydroxymethylpyrimidine kinase/phosphomethylpyrimidine kinase [Spirochaetaceae bacterium]
MTKVATIAGSDASGGAGLEADLKTFEEYGLYGMAAVTLVATMDPDANWGHRVFPLDETALRAQLETIFKGVGVAAAKSGMLGTFYAVELTREYIEGYGIQNYVLDPVMVCKGAGEALNPELNASLAEKLLPLAAVVTPNLFEAAQLSGLESVSTQEEMREAARLIAAKGARTVFVKGGAKLYQAESSRTDSPQAPQTDSPQGATALDIFFDGVNFKALESPLIKTEWTHGAGCTTAAAIASGLARGLSVYNAVVLAKRFITESLSRSFPLNRWVGPGNPSGWRGEFR